LTHKIIRYIDHTLLKPDANRTQIMQLCEEARAYRFAAVCVNPSWIPLVHHILRDEPEIAVCAVVGFPLGAGLSAVKAFETRQVIEHGASEVDMVINIGLLKSGDDAAVLEDIVNIVGICKESRTVSKVIIETALLSEGEKERICRIVAESGADFIKTSTGFSTSGATVADVKLLHKLVAPKNVKVKAAGGIRSAEDAISMIKAGAARIGTSSGIKIVEEITKKKLSF